LKDCEEIALDYDNFRVFCEIHADQCEFQEESDGESSEREVEIEGDEESMGENEDFGEKVMKKIKNDQGKWEEKLGFSNKENSLFKVKHGENGNLNGFIGEILLKI